MIGEYGVTVWAVYLGVWPESEFTEEAYAAAIAPAEALGYALFGWSDLFCDIGAYQGLEVNPDIPHNVAVLYFATEEDARLVTLELGATAVGYIPVEWGCAD